MTDETPPLRGRKLGDRRVRIERPHTRYFRYAAPGVVTARPTANEPTTGAGRTFARIRRTLFGAPIATEAEGEERLTKVKALAVFSSDALSSVAYATEAILFTLAIAGSAHFDLALPISMAIVGILGIVTLSYRQTIHAYPGGGGSYIVAKSNLGMFPGLVAASALLTDYVLTVSVSVSAGVAALASAFPGPIGDYRAFIAVFLIGLVMIVNLRGVRESGTIFAIPTYVFLVGALALIATGIIKILLGFPMQVTDVQPLHEAAQELTFFLVLRAFADGCSAMTGVEAISNGVPAFKKPEEKNARTTIVWMAVLLGIMFIGISFLSGVVNAVPSEHETILSQITRAVWGEGPIYLIFSFATTGILILAANTSFADFPRLSSLLARDKFMPTQFGFRGERLAFNSGIVALSIAASIVVLVFGGRVEALIPLYAIGVFTSFTLSQAGMVKHWFHDRGPGWRRSMVINSIGAVLTAIVAIIFAAVKFALGAWVIIVIIPIMVGLMWFIHREYTRRIIALQIQPGSILTPPVKKRRVVVPVPEIRKDILEALNFARTLSGDVVAVHVTDNVEEGEALRAQFEIQVPGIDFVIIESPYRSLVNPLIRYLELTAEEEDDDLTVVVLPEYVPRHWWERILHNQNAHRIRQALLGRPGILVANVPYRSEDISSGTRI